LLGVELEEVDVVVVVVHADVRHPFRHTALDARALVAREVESAGLPDELEQRVERRLLPLRVHAASPACPRAGPLSTGSRCAVAATRSSDSWTSCACSPAVTARRR